MYSEKLIDFVETGTFVRKELSRPGVTQNERKEAKDEALWERPEPQPRPEPRPEPHPAPRLSPPRAPPLPAPAAPLLQEARRGNEHVGPLDWI